MSPEDTPKDPLEGLSEEDRELIQAMDSQGLSCQAIAAVVGDVLNEILGQWWFIEIMEDRARRESEEDSDE